MPKLGSKRPSALTPLPGGGCRGSRLGEQLARQESRSPEEGAELGLYARGASGRAERSSGGQSCAPTFLSYSHQWHVHDPADPAETETKSINRKNCWQAPVCRLYRGAPRRLRAPSPAPCRPSSSSPGWRCKPHLPRAQPRATTNRPPTKKSLSLGEQNPENWFQEGLLKRSVPLNLTHVLNAY